jgi:hypothetical protein
MDCQLLVDDGLSVIGGCWTVSYWWMVDCQLLVDGLSVIEVFQNIAA